MATTKTLKVDDITILDGGLGTELEFRGYDLSKDPLWSAGLVRRDPKALADIHRAYLEAGADVITTATYQGCIETLGENLFAEIVRIAVRARNEFVRDHRENFEFAGEPKHSKDETSDLVTVSSSSTTVNSTVINSETQKQRRKWPLVAVSMGPYGAYLGKGQEYTGDYGNVSKATLLDFHRLKLEALDAEGIEPEILVFETIPNSLELAAITELLQQREKLREQRKVTSKPQVWLALSVRFETIDDRDHVLLADGASLTASNSCSVVNGLRTQLRATAPYISAVGINCCPLHEAALALAELNDVFQQNPNDTSVSSGPLKLIVYPNSGEVYSGETKTWSQPIPRNSSKDDGKVCDATTTKPSSKGSSWGLAEKSQEWIKHGARIIGGCCRTRPEDITKLKETIDELLG